MTWRLAICAPWPHSNVCPDILYVHRVRGSRFDSYLPILRSAWLSSSATSNASLPASPDPAWTLATTPEEFSKAVEAAEMFISQPLNYLGSRRHDL